MASRYSSKEDDLIRQLYPAYNLMLSAMPGRTRKGLEYRAQELGIAEARHVWTIKEFRTFEAASIRGASWSEVATLLPRRSLQSLRSQAQSLGLKFRKRYVRVTDPALAAVRAQAAALGISLVELDQKARTGRFFAQSSYRRPSLKHLVAGARALGGEVYIEWEAID